MTALGIVGALLLSLLALAIICVLVLETVREARGPFEGRHRE